MNSLLKLTLAAACAAGFTTAFANDNCKATANNLKSIGLTMDQRLICFSESRPGNARTLGTVYGLQMDTKLVGIDYRVQNSRLYGVGDMGGVYLLDTVSAAAMLVNRLTVALDGTSFGVDFNPAADRLRIISNTGQNLRHDVNLGVTSLDDALDYPPGTPLNTSGPTALGVAAAAYTNNDLDLNTATTLFVIDSTLDQVAIQAPPNNGSLAATGKLGLDADTTVGFDIHSKQRNGSTASVRALASITTPTSPTSLYSVNLVNGKASPRGAFMPTDRVIDIAIPLGQP
jgi:Domain of unknown function (DUF4394)